jgi:hypothetical protein
LREPEHPPSDVRGQQRLVIVDPEQGSCPRVITIHRVQHRTLEKGLLFSATGKYRPSLSSWMKI